MRFVTFILFAVFLFGSPAFSKSILLNKAGDWEILFDNDTNNIAIVHQENKTVISLHLIPDQSPYLTISLLNDSNITDDQFSIKFEIDQNSYNLDKDNFANDQGFSTFRMNIASDQLKDFIHVLTSGKSGLILAGSSGTPVSMIGTSSVIGYILQYIDKNHIVGLPPPFDYIELPVIENVPSSQDNQVIQTQNSTIQSQPVETPPTHEIYQEKNYGFLLFIVCSSLIIFILFQVFFYFKRKKIRKALYLASNEIQNKAQILRVKHAQLIYYDDYGNIKFDRWVREEINFIEKCIVPILVYNNLFKFFPFIQTQIYQEINQVIEDNEGIERARLLIKNEINKCSKILYLKKEQLTYKDDYGTIIYDQWLNEMNRFIERRIKPILSDAGLIEFYPFIVAEIKKMINSAADVRPENYEELQFQFAQNADTYSPTMNPFDYEEYCAKLLRKVGWEAQATVASGDQGADVIATKNGVKVILQCKLYSKPVNNKAVQEINAAKTYYHADYAAVVSNADYTVSARQLASSTKVALLHHDELQSYVKSLEDTTMKSNDASAGLHFVN